MAVICCYYGTVLVSFEEPIIYTSKSILLNLPVTDNIKNSPRLNIFNCWLECFVQIWGHIHNPPKPNFILNSIHLSSFYPFTGYNPRIWNLSIHYLSVISQLSQHNTSFKGHKAHNQISTLQYTIPVLRLIEHAIKYPHYSTVNIIHFI